MVSRRRFPAAGSEEVILAALRLTMTQRLQAHTFLRVLLVQTSLDNLLLPLTRLHYCVNLNEEKITTHLVRGH